LRRTRSDTRAKRYIDPENLEGVNALDLRVGDVALVEAGDIIPGDSNIVEGVASVNESAITGESAPVIREAGGGGADLLHHRGIGPKPVGDDAARSPYFFMIRLRSFSAAALFRFEVTTASNTSPS
jgi:magnesium-transporting ATPase (P-type)